MFFGQSPQDTRAFFFSSWKKYREQQALNALEQQLVEIILLHPHYHALLECDPVSSLQHPDPRVGDTNPFLHMGLHCAIREQVALDRPPGIARIHHALLQKYHDRCTVDHLLMEILEGCLWRAQRDHQMPDENRYLSACQALLEE